MKAQRNRDLTVGKRCIDIHVHLAGVGTGGSGCFVSRKMRRTLVFHLLKRWIGLDPKDPEADAIFSRKLARLVSESPHLDAAVVLALDGVYTADGILNRERSHLYVPNDYLFRVCREHEVLLPGPSINPMRRDALEELARCDDAGAILIKWLPPLQRFDPAASYCDPFYEELARRQLPLLTHTGCEHTFPEMAQELGHPARCRRALEAGVQLIVAHSGVACRFHRRWHQPAEVVRLIREFPNLWADDSALSSFLKYRHLRRIPYGDFPGRFVHGSDYPIPPMAIPFVRRLGLKKTLKLTFGGNPMETDWQIKAAAGIPEDVFTNAATLLAPRIEKWNRRCTQMKNEG